MARPGLGRAYYPGINSPWRRLVFMPIFIRIGDAGAPTVMGGSLPNVEVALGAAGTYTVTLPHGTEPRGLANPRPPFGVLSTEVTHVATVGPRARVSAMDSSAGTMTVLTFATDADDVPDNLTEGSIIHLMLACEGW